MGFPAARISDFHSCPVQVTVVPAAKGGTCEDDTPAITIPHVGGYIVGDCSPDVNVNGLKAARAGDKASCFGTPPIDLIVTGASDVFINGRLAAVLGSKTYHGGKVEAPCSPDVNMGSALAGATFGDAAAATAACKEAAEKRKKYKDKDYLGNPIPDDKRDMSQGKDMNCGQESVRQLCIQKCKKSGQPSSPACQACNTSEDDWHAKYMKDEKDKHNEVNEEYRKKVRERNDKVWSEQVQKAGCVTTERYKGQIDPGSTTWEKYQGQTLYLWSGSKPTVNNSPKSTVTIERLPSTIEDPDKAAKDGQIGSYPETRQDMLKKQCGIDSTLGENTTQGIAGDVADGKSVIAAVDVGTLNGNPPQGLHAVTVTSMQFDDNGNLVKVTLNDTGNPNGTKVCGREMKGADLDNFNKSLAPGTQTNVA